MKIRCLVAIILLWVIFSVKKSPAQSSKNDSRFMENVLKPVLTVDPKPRLDSSLIISKFGDLEIGKLLLLMLEIDQQYRDSLYNGSKDEKKQQYFRRLMFRDDKINQVILDKIISKSGWPSDAVFGEKSSLSAYLIIWHGKKEYHLKHFALIERAFRQKQFSKEMYIVIRDRVWGYK